MVCSATFSTIAVNHSAKRRCPVRVKTQAKGLSRACQIDQSNVACVIESQLLDVIAVGQVTSGLLFTTARFIGYVLGGPSGAVVAAVGIFLPAFVFVAACGPLTPLIRRSAPAGAFLEGVHVASLALMAVVTWQLGRSALVDVPTAILAAASVVLLIGYLVNSACLILAGATFGLLASAVGAG